MSSETISGVRQWPDPPAEEAYYGLAGDVVRAIGPHTEASRVALLTQTLVCFGNVIGRTAYFMAEASKHFMNILADHKEGLQLLRGSLGVAKGDSTR